jgi:hypothetical protein
MKTILLICSFIICANIYSQSILSDTKDVASNTRMLATGTNPLHKSFAKTVQVQSQVTIQDESITSYDLNFTAPDVQTTDNTNSSSNTCLLKDESGNIISGILNMSSSADQSSYTCKFSKDDFYKIVALKITDVQIITANGKGNLFSVDKNLQYIIAKQAKALLNRFKNQE